MVETTPTVALVNPRMFIQAYKFFPLSLGYLASALDLAEISWSFHDLHIDWIKTSKVIEAIQRDGAPRLFALTGLLTSFQSIQELCASLRKAFPESKIVLGGKITVMDPEFIYKHMDLDYIIQGEGELALVQLVNALDHPEQIKEVEGLVYRGQLGEIINNGEARAVKNISGFDIPYHKFEMEKYIELCNIQSPDVPSINILSSRGCPYTCTFCNNSIGPRSVRFYKIEQIDRALTYLKESYGLQHVTFNDDIFTVNKKHMARVCDLMKQKELTFSISTRLDFLTPESIKMLDESGCHYLCVGIESPSPTVAEIIDKRLDLEKYQKNIDALRSSRIIVNYGFIIGYLGETEETIAETREFVLRNKIIYSAFFANAFPRTLLYNMIRDRIPDEEEYLKKLYTVDLSQNYLVNMTDIPEKRLFRLRDELIADSVLNAIGISSRFLKFFARQGALLYLLLMRTTGLKLSFLKVAFEYINMNIIKPLSKRRAVSQEG